MIESNHNINFPDIINILDPTLEKLTINISDTSEKTFTPDEGFDGFSEIKVNKISGIYASDIRLGKEILGVKGTLKQLIGEEINIKPLTEEQIIFPSFGFTGITKIVVDKMKLGVLNPDRNGNYNAVDYELDGFNEVNVNIESADVNISEDRRSYSPADFGTGLINNINVDCTDYWYYDRLNQPLAQVTDYIKNIREVFDLSGVGNINRFYNGYKGKVINVNFSNASNINTAQRLFYNNPECETINIINFNPLILTDFSLMFQGIQNVKVINGLNNLNTLNATNMSSMFSTCPKLEKIDVSSFNTSNVTNMSYMFSGCTVLKEINMSTFTGSNVTNITSMFGACTSLEKIDMQNFDFGKVSTYTNFLANVPTNCYILVKDETAKNWILDKYPTMTNIHIKGE